MKKIFTLTFIICTLNFSVKGQSLLTENFSFTATDIAGQNGWSVHSGTADPVGTTTGLTYTGYHGSNIGNAANVIGAGFDYNKALTASQNTNGTVIYTSLLLNFTQPAATATTGGVFFHLGNRVSETSFTSFCARLWAKTDAAGVLNIGISNGSAATASTYSATPYALNTTYLVIIKYEINTGGADAVSLWIKSTGVPANEAAAGAPDVTVTTENGLDAINAVGIRQAANIPDVVIDGINVGLSWDNAVLPSTLKSFSASLINGTAQLNWATTNEVNVNGFSIEKSSDARSFTSIGFVAAKNAAAANYNFNTVLAAGINYYRLKMIDKDGSFTYSGIVTLQSKSSSKLEIFPNPVAQSATITHDVAVENAVIKVVAVDGRVLSITNLQTGAIQSTVDVSGLQKGNYFLVVDNNGKRSSLQFIKQ